MRHFYNSQSHTLLEFSFLFNWTINILTSSANNNTAWLLTLFQRSFLVNKLTYWFCQSGSIVCVHSLACLANRSSSRSDCWSLASLAAASRSTRLLAASTMRACSSLWRSASSAHFAGKFEGLEWEWSKVIEFKWNNRPRVCFWGLHIKMHILFSCNWTY